MDNGEVGVPIRAALRPAEEDVKLGPGTVTLHHQLMVEETVMEHTKEEGSATLMLVLSLVKTYQLVICLALKKRQWLLNKQRTSMRQCQTYLLLYHWFHWFHLLVEIFSVT